MMIKINKSLILASQSVIRKQMLEKIGLTFQVVASKFNEDNLKSKLSNLTFSKQALELAKKKALIVSQNYPNHIIIAADQIAAINEIKHILSKPVTYKKAIEQLSIMQGKTHSQNNGLCLAYNQQIIWQHTETAIITMRKLTKQEIEIYVKKDMPLNSCGSYQLENYAKHLFKKIDGSDDCVLGLSLTPLLNKLYDLKAISFKIF